mmetsp:Transcript_22838/g.39022  ORF Transcript_22838/g.39022 Transcript_22838/m.39022 type:complete len:133 (+) Transcript_22838:26-424(+)
MRTTTLLLLLVAPAGALLLPALPARISSSTRRALGAIHMTEAEDAPMPSPPEPVLDEEEAAAAAAEAARQAAYERGLKETMERQTDFSRLDTKIAGVVLVIALFAAGLEIANPDQCAFLPDLKPDTCVRVDP